MENIQWIYLDPQGSTQGPFGPKDMMEWFTHGYFPKVEKQFKPRDILHMLNHVTIHQRVQPRDLFYKFYETKWLIASIWSLRNSLSI